MDCPSCGHENREGARFCEACGKELALVCPSCTAELRPSDRFCGACGHELSIPPEAPPQDRPLDNKLDQLQRYLPHHLTEKILSSRGRLQGERKLVTVLFADIVGYTGLSEQMGEETLFTLMDEIYELFIHEVHRYEGTVNELTGDGIVAFFGAPLAVVVVQFSCRVP
jgi:hypothetical protein